MIYGSVCSGIEAATIAWHPLGWRAAFFSEIEEFTRALLIHHYPAIPLHGDFTTIQDSAYAAIDVLVGGTPCQSFSVAGLRQGYADQRGLLSLEFIRLAQRLKPRWLVWENVPGVLSIDGGRAFGCFLGGLAECGYGFAYRILDAQYFGVPQRRRRVFIVGYLGDWRPPAAVLFERDCLRRDITPRRETRESVAYDLAPSLTGSGRGVERIGESRGQDPVIAAIYSPPLTSNPYGDHESREGLLVAHSLCAEGFDASEDGTGRGTPLVPMTLAIRGRNDEARLEFRQDGIANAVLSPTGGRSGTGCGAVAIAQNGSGEVLSADVMYSLTAGGEKPGQGYPAVAFTLHGTDKTVSTASETEIAGSVRTQSPGRIENSSTTAVLQTMAVRRLTPRECERLQGFPDDYTLIPFRGRPAPDSRRYESLGNSMAVPVMRWIGERIALVESLIHGL
jgi:DNA (cytosine-5)-methyltransferase 1